MKTLILNHYKNTALVSNSEEAVSFINSLPGISANQSTVKNLESFFDGTNAYMMNTLKSGKAYEIATTGCGMSRIHAYRPQATTLEAHNEIVKENKERQAKEDIQRRVERNAAHLEEMYEPMKGWHIVTITGTAFKLQGNDGQVTKSVRILADNKMDAYNKAIEFLTENPPKNVMNWMTFESSRSAMFEFVGVWTDEAEMEYGN